MPAEVARRVANNMFSHCGNFNFPKCQYLYLFEVLTIIISEMLAIINSKKLITVFSDLLAKMIYKMLANIIFEVLAIIFSRNDGNYKFRT